jgi:tetratricopeptide (TPR) repeat protein
MKNLALALAAGVLAYGVGAAVAGWWAGFLPGLIALVAAYFVLARRTGKKVEAIFQQAVAEMQAGRLDGARRVMEAALPLGTEQFLVTAQVHAQLGALDYLEGVGLVVQKQAKGGAAKLASARAHLEKAWSRDWRSKTMLACLHHREGNIDEALKVFAAAEGPGRSEPLSWGAWAYVLNAAMRRDEALQVVGRGLKQIPDCKPLRAIQEDMSNRRRPDMKVFGEGWYQFFPDQVPQEVLMQQAQAMRRGANSPMTVPPPRR